MPADLTPTLYKARVGLVRPLSEFGGGERGRSLGTRPRPTPWFSNNLPAFGPIKGAGAVLAPSGGELERGLSMSL